MSRTNPYLLLSALVMTTGCWQAEPTTETDHATDNAPLQVADDSPPKTPEVDLNTRLAELTRQANQYESSHQFKQAVATWKQIDGIVSEKFGPESWQAANAKLAGIMASQQAEFDATQLQQLKSMQEIQSKIRDAFASGNLAAAQQYNERSVELTRELFGENSALFGKQLLQTASLARQLGQTETAIRYYHQAINNLKATFRARHPDIELAHAELGRLYLRRQKYVPAIENLKEATRLAANLWGERSLQYANQANELGVAYQKAGQLDVALKVIQASEVIRRNKLSDKHAAVGHSHLNLGLVFFGKKDYLAAAQHLEHAISIFESQPRPPVEFLTVARSKLSTVHMITGQPDLAEPLLEQVVQASFTSSADPNPRTAEFQYRHAVALAKQGKYDQAEPIFLTAYQTQQEQLGAEHPDTIQTMKAIAVLLKQTRRLAESQEFIEKIQHLSKKNSDASNEFQR